MPPAINSHVLTCFLVSCDSVTSIRICPVHFRIGVQDFTREMYDARAAAKFTAWRRRVRAYT